MNKKERNFLTLIVGFTMGGFVISVLSTLYQIPYLPIIGIIIMFTAITIFFYKAISPED